MDDDEPVALPCAVCVGDEEIESVTVFVKESRELALDRALALAADALVVALLNALTDGCLDEDELGETEPAPDGEALALNDTLVTPDALEH